VSKKTITLSSISTVFVVLIIALAVLLVSNYTKNFNSGINLEPEILDLKTNLKNDSGQDMVWLFDNATDINNVITGQNIASDVFENHIILGILGTTYPNSGYTFGLNYARVRGTDVNINYQVQKPTDDQAYLEVISYPQLFLKVNKDMLQIGTSLDFMFYNQTTKKQEIINQTITL